MDLLGTHIEPISLIQGGRRIAISDAVVIFDSTYGSLRLSEPAFTKASELLARLKRANLLVEDTTEAPISAEFLEHMEAWLSQLKPCEVIAATEAITDGLLRVYKPGSFVIRHGYNSGTPVDTVIIEPMLMEGPSGSELCYRCKDVGLGREYILQQNAIAAIGDNWNEVLWNPTTREFAEEEAPLSEISLV